MNVNTARCHFVTQKQTPQKTFNSETSQFANEMILVVLILSKLQSKYILARRLSTFSPDLPMNSKEVRYGLDPRAKLFLNAMKFATIVFGCFSAAKLMPSRDQKYHSGQLQSS